MKRELQLTELARLQLQDWHRTAVDRLPAEVRQREHEAILALLKRQLAPSTYAVVASVRDSGSAWLDDVERALAQDHESYFRVLEAILAGDAP